jgi:hypothetical protein
MTMKTDPHLQAFLKPIEGSPWMKLIGPHDAMPERHMIAFSTDELEYRLRQFRDAVRADLDGRLTARVAVLEPVLRDLADKHAELVSSGDCGSWDVEKEPEMIAARAALAKQKTPSSPVNPTVEPA